MNPVVLNPRSALHALEPFGVGTSDVESLQSYFCRLALSHSTTTQELSRLVARRIGQEIAHDFKWHQRQISGIRESALTWSSALSALTTVTDLDGLTFRPWHKVISQNGLSIAKQGQFCPDCFAEDKATGQQPYFRLAWELKTVTVCSRHRTPLAQQCPACFKDNVRHAAAFVVPGWCTHCGEFLGGPAKDQEHHAIEPAAMWTARQVGELVASQTATTERPVHANLVEAIKLIITEMDGGQSAVFARRIGVAKSTVHHWLHGDGTPTLEVSLKIAAQSGIALTDLLRGRISDWQPPASAQQLSLTLPKVEPRRRAHEKDRDWPELERQLQAFLLLPTPISVLEAARRLDVEARQLYLRMNRTTRQLGERWKFYIQRRHESHVAQAWPYIEAACRDIWSQGKAVTRREVAKRVPADILNPVTGLLDVIKDVQAHLACSGDVIE